MKIGILKYLFENTDHPVHLWQAKALFLSATVEFSAWVVVVGDFPGAGWWTGGRDEEEFTGLLAIFMSIYRPVWQTTTICEILWTIEFDFSERRKM